MLLGISKEKRNDVGVECVMLNKVSIVEFFVLINQYYQIEREIDELVVWNNDLDMMISKNNNLAYE